MLERESDGEKKRAIQSIECMRERERERKLVPSGSERGQVRTNDAA